MDLIKESVEMLYDVFDDISIINNEDRIVSIKKELSNCMVMPNQMIYAICYNPFHIFYHKNIGNFLGLDEDNMDSMEIIECIHEEDIHFVANAIKHAFEWIHDNSEKKILFSLKYRMRHKQGHILTIQRNTRIIDLDCNNNVIITLSVVTDITPFQNGAFNAEACIHSMNNVEYYYSSINNNILEFNISNREKDVLKLLCFGYSSKDIADKLFISKHTVDVHRRHLLDKTKLKNTKELVYFAFQKGIIDDMKNAI
jgi:DNA-binding CsgD family transcriptional regulator